MMVIASGQVEQPIRDFCTGSPRHPSFSTPALAAGCCKSSAKVPDATFISVESLMHFYGQKDTLCFQTNKTSKYVCVFLSEFNWDLL